MVYGLIKGANLMGTTDDDGRRKDPEGVKNRDNIQAIGRKAEERDRNAKDGNPEGIPADGGSSDAPQIPEND